MNAESICDGWHASGMICVLRWHDVKTPHKAAVVHNDEPRIFTWAAEMSELREENQIAFNRPGSSPDGKRLDEWKHGQFIGLQMDLRGTTWKFTIRNNVAETLGVVIACEDGLIILHCAQHGTFGYYESLPVIAPNKGIRFYLASVESDNLAAKATRYLPEGKAKRMAQHYLVEMWPFVVTSLKKSMEVAR